MRDKPGVVGLNDIDVPEFSQENALMPVVYVAPRRCYVRGLVSGALKG